MKKSPNARATTRHLKNHQSVPFKWQNVLKYNLNKIYLTTNIEL